MTGGRSRFTPGGAAAVILLVAARLAPAAEERAVHVELAPVTALAPGERVDRISLPAALAEAEAGGPGPLLARAALEESQAAHARSFEQLLPGLSIAGLARHTEGAVQATLGEVLDADYSTVQLEGSLHLDLSMAKWGAEKAARARLQAALADVDEAARLAEKVVVEAYLEVQRGRARLAAAEAARREAEESAAVQDARYRAGSALKADWLRHQARVAETRLLELAARLESRVASLLLARTLGRDPEVLLVPAEDDVAAPPAALEADVAALTTAALGARPDLAAGRERLAAERRELRAAADASFWPTLTLDARKGMLGDSVGDARARTVYGAWLEWSLFDTRGGSVVSRRAEARARVRRREAELVDLEQQVKAEILNALARERIAREAVEAASFGVAAASEALAVRRVRERSGLESSLDVIEAERDLARARFLQADALVDAVLARYRVRVAVGERLVDAPTAQ